MKGLRKVRELAVGDAPKDPIAADACMQQALLASLLEENRILRQENLTLLSELGQGSQPSAAESLLEELEQAHQANDALQRSTSWRVTAPLRAIGRSIAVGRGFLNDSIRPRLRYAKVARSETPFQPRLFSKSAP
jgi:hypothetical protein